MLSGVCSSPSTAVRDAFAGEDAGEGGGDVEVESVAELVELGAAVGLDAGGFVASVVTAEVGFAERAEELAEGFVAEEVHALVGDFEAGFGVAVALLTLALLGLLGVDEVLLLHLLDDLVDEFFDLSSATSCRIFPGTSSSKSSPDSSAWRMASRRFSRVWSPLNSWKLGVGVVEAGVEEEVGEGLHEVFETEAGGEVAGELGVADALHKAPSFILDLWRMAHPCLCGDADTDKTLPIYFPLRLLEEHNRRSRWCCRRCVWRRWVSGGLRGLLGGICAGLTWCE